MSRRNEFRRLLVDMGAIQEYKPNFNASLTRAAQKRMGFFDNQPAEYRELMNEFGVHVVNSFVEAGVKKPNTIRHLINVARGNSGDGNPSYGGNGPQAKLRRYKARRFAMSE
jgi:hypothetical protein